jgi:hypothetical protein
LGTHDRFGDQAATCERLRGNDYQWFHTEEIEQGIACDPLKVAI